MRNLGLEYRESISIHALRKESDINVVVIKSMRFTFQSTLSVRRATRADRAAGVCLEISIHALRKESDPPPSGLVSLMANFNPRSP